MSADIQPRTGLALLEHDADLARAIPTKDLPLARRNLVVPVRQLSPGAIDPADLQLPESTFGLLVLEGELTSDVALDGRSLTEVLVPGDVGTPWAPQVESMPVRRSLVATTPVKLAVLESRFLLASARWPSLMVAIQRRMAEQKHRLAVHGAICQFPRVEDRLLAMLRHLAERTGRVTAEGTLVPVPLTHEGLGKLVGARRPTISLAVKELTQSGLLGRREDGTWLLLDGAQPGSD